MIFDDRMRKELKQRFTKMNIDNTFYNYIKRIINSIPESQQIDILNKIDCSLIRFIINPSPTIQRFVISVDVDHIQWIHNPVKDVQLKAVEINPTLINLVHNPCDEIKILQQLQ